MSADGRPVERGLTVGAMSGKVHSFFQQELLHAVAAVCAGIQDRVPGLLRGGFLKESPDGFEPAEAGGARSRLLTPREGARLMGLPEDYRLPSVKTAALHLVGDGVAVPVVRHLAQTLLEPLLAQEGVLTERAPDEDECKNIQYGLGVAAALAGFDIGQTVVVAAQACVAVEAMEGTDATIERAGRLMATLEAEASTLERRLTVVKVAKPKQDMRFDVPVIGLSTVETMLRAGASCLSIEAGKTLLFDREALLKRANDTGVTIVAAPR